ncbi:MAG: hypothetical protein JWL70_1692, partial [Acidimicrobiia bacterium]|nr:hypothetical protein [Acidimicrobiia bacterium]
AIGIPLKEDRERAWADFAGWRVNYDTVLVSLAKMVYAPPGVWSSDRPADRYVPRVFARHGARSSVQRRPSGRRRWASPSRRADD